MSDPRSELKKTWARVVAKAWADEEYKRRLLADPAAVAREESVPIPPGVSVKVVEQAPGVTATYEKTATTLCLVLPAPPASVRAGVEADVRAAADAPPDTCFEFYCG